MYMMLWRTVAEKTFAVVALFREIASSMYIGSLIYVSNCLILPSRI